MKKNKIINGILFALLGACVVAYLVCLIVMKEETLEFTEKAKDFINQPLPIIGVSIVVLGGVLVKILSLSKYGQSQIAKAEEKIEEYKELIETNKTDLEALLEAKQAEIDELKATIVKVAENVPNKKVKAIAEELKGE